MPDPSLEFRSTSLPSGCSRHGSHEGRIKAPLLIVDQGLTMPAVRANECDRFDAQPPGTTMQATEHERFTKKAAEAISLATDPLVTATHRDLPEQYQHSAG